MSHVLVLWVRSVEVIDLEVFDVTRSRILVGERVARARGLHPLELPRVGDLQL